MTDDERRIITDFVQRVSGANAGAAAPSGPWGNTGRGSVPPSQPPLPPVDREADALIADLFSRFPEARYRITQTAFVQEHALVQAQNRIQELEWQLENTQRQAQAAQQSRGGLFGGMFGGGAPRQAPMAPPPQPLPPPPGYGAMQQAPAQGGGGGFLRTAAMTAAGVAGGMVLGNVLMNAFSGGGHANAAGFSGLGGGSGAFGQEAVPTAASPWSDPGTAAAQQGWTDSGSDKFADTDGGEKAGWGNTGGGGNDAWGSGYDDSSNTSDTGGYDDDAGSGGYDEEV